MASKIPQKTLANMLSAWIAASTVKARLVMSDTTCGAEIDGIDNLSDYTVIDVCDATGYADVLVTTEAATADDVNNRAEYGADTAVFSGLAGDATRQIVGCLLYDYVDGTDAHDKSPFYIEFISPIPATATQVSAQWHAEGIVQFAQV